MNQDHTTSTQYLGSPGEDPSTPFWGSGNYVGPHWSNGKLQESVAFGDAPAMHELDALARLHDTAYATYKDDKHLAAADLIFAEEAEKLKKKYGPKWAENPQVAAALVRYGNHTKRAATRIGANVSSGFKLGGAFGALGGLLYSGVQNIRQSNQMINGTYLKTQKDDIRRLYARDPHVDAHGTQGKTAVVSSKTPEKVASNARADVLALGKTGKQLLQKMKNLVTQPKVHPTVEEKKPTHPDWAAKQAQRFQNYQALKDAAQASVGKPRKQKSKKHFNSVLPDSYKRKRKNSKLKKLLVRTA